MQPLLGTKSKDEACILVIAPSIEDAEQYAELRLGPAFAQGR